MIKIMQKEGDVAFLGSPRAKKYIVTFPQEMSMHGCSKGISKMTPPYFLTVFNK